MSHGKIHDKHCPPYGVIWLLGHDVQKFSVEHVKHWLEQALQVFEEVSR